MVSRSFRVPMCRFTEPVGVDEFFKESEEVSTVRQLENINKSRVLNFVFWQLLQEYVSVTYLHDIKLVFSNGHPESMEVCSIEQMDEFLDIWMTPEGAATAKNMILKDIHLYYKAAYDRFPFDCKL